MKDMHMYREPKAQPATDETTIDEQAPVVDEVTSSDREHNHHPAHRAQDHLRHSHGKKNAELNKQ